MFNIFWDACKRYYGSNHYGIGPNYECVLGEMTALASWLSPPPFGTPTLEVIDGGAPVRALEWLRYPSDKYAARKLILSQQAFLLEKLAEHMRDLSKAFDRQLPEFSRYTKFIQRLRNSFELGVYNLNFDTVARSAWPEAFFGFDRHGRFDPSCVHQRNQWGFIYHLHGSVHHCINGHTHQIEWKDDLGSGFTDRLDIGPDMAQDFIWVPLTTLVAGGFKLDQLLTDPYQTFYSALVRHIQEADAFLIAGYGFGDPHVNRALRNRFERTDDVVTIPKVVVLEKSERDRLQSASLQSHSFWSYQLTHTLNTRFQISNEHIDRSLTVAPFIENGVLETDASDRVAIWYAGFSEAISSVDNVRKWLQTTT